MAAKPIPDNYPIATPYLCVSDAAEAIEFYKQVFGATERMRIDAPGGRIGHAELSIGSALIMLADEYPEMDFRSPTSLGGSPVVIHLYVADVDQVCERAVAAGAELTRPIASLVGRHSYRGREFRGDEEARRGGDARLAGCC